MTKIISKRWVLAMLMLGGAPISSWADNAEVLPKGVSQIRASYTDYFTIEKRYNPNGDEEEIATDFNAILDSSIFPDLSAIEAAFGMPPGSGNLGRSVADFRYDVKILEINLERGITDKLSIGVKIPYWKFNNHVEASLDASAATLGLNTFFGTMGDPYGGSPFAPIGLPGVSALTTEDIQAILTGGLFINGQLAVPGFGFKRFENWSRQGFSDIEAGARYQYFKDEKWRLAFTGGLRLPTGEVDDPDNLTDFPFGSGAYAVLFRFNNDYLGFKNWLLNATLLYDWVLPEHETLRVPNSVNQPLTANRETVDRDIGDRIELDLSAKYHFSKAWSTTLQYLRAKKGRDRVSGSQGLSYTSLEQETDMEEEQFLLGVTYSTISQYLATKKGIPMTATLTYRDRFDGTNNVLKSKYLKAEVRILF